MAGKGTRKRGGRRKGKERVEWEEEEGQRYEDGKGHSRMWKD
jgi:hypothetical protein